LAVLSSLDIQGAYQQMIDRSLSGAHYPIHACSTCVPHYARQYIGNCYSMIRHKAFNCHASNIEKCAC
jgi:hypothetical protein